MTLSISHLTYDKHSERLVVICDTDLDITRVRLRIDGVTQPGRFHETIYGDLYAHAPDVWGVPDLGFGPSVASLLYTTPGSDFGVGKPNSTLGTTQTTPEAVLPLLWDAGFRSEQHLLWCLSIMRGESGFWVRARNWLPMDGFRPVGTAIGVEGPAAAWNQGHTQQGHSDRGLVQWNSRAHPDISDADADDPAKAIGWMFKKTGNATAPIWTPWGGGAGGAAYSKFFPEFSDLVAQFVASKAGA